MNTFHYLKFSLRVIFLLFYNHAAHATTVSQNNNIWLHEVGKAQINTRWAFGLEATLRRTDWGQKNQQWFIRPSIEYSLNSKLTATLGYTRYQNYTYGNPAIFSTPAYEDHIWVQMGFKQQTCKWKISHRLRDENRFVSTGASQTDYRNRVRYMVLFSRPVLSNHNKVLISATLGDEAFFNIGSFSGKSLMNQNRMIAGFTWHAFKNTDIQASYIHQHIWNFSNTIRESNPTIRLTIYHTIQFNSHVNSQSKS